MILAPGATIGILGGGQLGRMTALAAAALGYRCHVFAQEPDAPAAQVCTAATIAPFSDGDALGRFAAAVDVATFEFENIPAEAVRHVAAAAPVRPRPQILEITPETTLLERAFCARSGSLRPNFAPSRTPARWRPRWPSWGGPAVLKKRADGI